jgi:hypothetical protein
MYRQADLETDIVRIVRQLQRNYKHVFPWMVAAHLPIYRAEATLRRDMAGLAKSGQLVRVGGESARRGYCAPVEFIKCGAVAFKNAV